MFIALGTSRLAIALMLGPWVVLGVLRLYEWALDGIAKNKAGIWRLGVALSVLLSITSWLWFFLRGHELSSDEGSILAAMFYGPWVLLGVFRAIGWTCGAFAKKKAGD